MKFYTFLIFMILQANAFANLTQSEAIERRKQVQSVSYEINLSFKKFTPEFDGIVKLNVEMNDITMPLRVDLRPKELKSVSVDGAIVKPSNVTSDSFYIPVVNLKKKFSIIVNYVGTKGSADLTSFNDPDGSEYFYTNLEPYGAHSIFPCFNQPDIKASYDLTVTAPSDWKIIANELPLSRIEKNDHSIHKFKKTPPFSTYLFFVGGGPFVEWTDKHNGLPLTLYARKGLAKYVDHKEIFRVTKKGLDFFSSYFEYPMPFSKYGQIFVPNFPGMGMENPGAVTLNEKNIFQGQTVQALKLKREDLILHELAHMWFGDLVTMKWWDDLWLNEAFASYFAGLGVKEALGRTSTDLHSQSTKYNSYKEDAYSTTHPVMGEVPDSMSAFASFDAITYTKGSSVLKQLHHLVGDEVFKKGLVFYFKTYAFKNTIFSDFLFSFEKFYGKSLMGWAASWLQTKGINSISTNFTCENGKLKTFVINMKPSIDDKFFIHKANFGLYKIDKNEVSRFHLEKIKFDKSETSLTHLTGKPCPDFVFPNEEDLDYGLYYLDEKSLQNVKTVMAYHPDSLSRYMLWNMLAYGVRNSTYTTDTFLEAALESFKVEDEGEVLNLVTGVLSNSRNSAFRDIFNIFATSEERSKYAPAFESQVFNRLLNLSKNDPFRQDLYQLYALIVQTKLGQDRIIQYLARAIPGTFEFNQDTRWRLLTALSRNGHPEAIKLADEEFKIDNSESGESQRYVVKTAFPDLKLRALMWDNFLNFFKISPSTAFDASEFVHSPNRPDMSTPFVQAYFDFVKNKDWIKDNSLVNFYFTRFFPTYVCSPDILKKSKEAFSLAKSLSPKARNRWLQLQEELELCVQRKQKINY